MKTGETELGYFETFSGIFQNDQDNDLISSRLDSEFAKRQPGLDCPGLAASSEGWTIQKKTTPLTGRSPGKISLSLFNTLFSGRRGNQKNSGPARSIRNILKSSLSPSLKTMPLSVETLITGFLPVPPRFGPSSEIYLNLN